MFPIVRNYDRHTLDGKPVCRILPSATLDWARPLSSDHAICMPIGSNTLRTILSNSWFQLIFPRLLEPCCRREAVIKGASGFSPRHSGQAKREPESSQRLVGATAWIPAFAGIWRLDISWNGRVKHTLRVELVGSASETRVWLRLYIHSGHNNRKAARKTGKNVQTPDSRVRGNDRYRRSMKNSEGSLR